MNQILEHELVAVTAHGRRCACGQPFTPEHLGEVALRVLGAPLSLDERRAAENRLNAAKVARNRAAAKARAAGDATAADLARARALLARMAAETQAVHDYLDSLELPTFCERADWLAAHRRDRRGFYPGGTYGHR